MADLLNYNTTRIWGTTKENNSISGTGFFYELFPNFLILITNKHVIEPIDKGLFFTCKSTLNGKPIDQEHQLFGFKKDDNHFRDHPNPEIDLCAMQIGSLINACNSKGISPFITYIEKKQIPFREEDVNSIYSMQDIYMFGYPNGLWDEINNKPIVRKGILSSNYKFDFNGRKEFIIDMACFPGSSGSPIFMNKEFEYDIANKSMTYKPDIKLVGILYAGPMFSTNGEILVKDTLTKRDIYTEISIPMNLGLAIKSQCILDFEKIFDPNETMKVKISNNFEEIIEDF